MAACSSGVGQDDRWRPWHHTRLRRRSRITWNKSASSSLEIVFSNGGGLKGRDFRLDIEGDDISDEALADYIVRDLRLLMVGSVAVSNKKIISEPHKRAS